VTLVVVHKKGIEILYDGYSWKILSI